MTKTNTNHNKEPVVWSLVQPTTTHRYSSIPPHVSDIQRGTERHVSLFLYSLLPLLLLLFFLIISKTNMCERGGRRRAETQDGAVSGRLNLYHVGETSNWEIHVPQNTDARLVFPPDEWEAIWKAPFFGCHVEEHTFILHPDLVLRRAYRPEITHFNLLVVCVVLNISLPTKTRNNSLIPQRSLLLLLLF